MICLYDGALLLVFVLCLPKLVWDCVFKKKYRKSWKARLIPRLPKEAHPPLIWLHAVSLGEVKALSALVPHIRNAHPKAFIYVTSATEAGQQEAQKRITEANGLGYLPLDFSWMMDRMVSYLRPSLLLLVEGEYWFNLIRHVKKYGGKIGVVSGKMSKKSLQRHRCISFFSRSIFQSIDYFCLQAEEEKTRFLQLGVDPSKIAITGNLKYDIPIEPSSDIDALKKRLHLKGKERVITLGSTHEGEETLLYTTLAPLLDQDPLLKIVIVPRHPKPRYLKRIFQTSGWITHPQVSFLNQIGILPTCYHLSYLVIVGGSFIPGIGGHDIFEPIKMGVPTLYGPYMHQQDSLELAIRHSGAARQVVPIQLREVVETILNHPLIHLEMSTKGKAFADQMKGKACATWKAIERSIWTENILDG